MNAKNRGRSVLRSRFSCKQFIPRLRGIFLCRTLAPEIRRACPVHAAGRFSDSCVSVHASLPGITCQWHFWRDSAITAAALRGSFTRLPFSRPQRGLTCACFHIQFIVLSYLLFASLSSRAHEVPFSLKPQAVSATHSGPGRNRPVSPRPLTCLAITTGSLFGRLTRVWRPLPYRFSISRT